MTQDTTWSLPALAGALAVPDEAFRAFTHLQGLGWNARLSLPQAATLAIAGQDAAGGTATGPVSDAVTGLFTALTTALGAAPPA